MYGTIRMHQEREYPAHVWGTDLINPDFAALARAYGAHGELVERTEEFAPAFERARNAGTAALIELRLDPEALTPRASLSQIRAARWPSRAPDRVFIRRVYAAGWRVSARSSAAPSVASSNGLKHERQRRGFGGALQRLDIGVSGEIDHRLGRSRRGSRPPPRCRLGRPPSRYPSGSRRAAPRSRARPPGRPCRHNRPPCSRAVSGPRKSSKRSECRPRPARRGGVPSVATSRDVRQMAAALETLEMASRAQPDGNKTDKRLKTCRYQT